MKRTLRFTFLVLLGMLVGAVSVPASASGPANSPAASSCATVRSFDVEAKARRNVYRVGETAVVTVWVADRFTGLPQSDVRAVVGVERGLGGAAMTDENGRAVVRVPLRPSWAKLGRPRAIAAASHIVTPPVCYLWRYGYRQYPHLFRIRP